jgi:hypothetical protein
MGARISWGAEFVAYGKQQARDLPSVTVQKNE